MSPSLRSSCRQSDDGDRELAIDLEDFDFDDVDLEINVDNGDDKLGPAIKFDDQPLMNDDLNEEFLLVPNDALARDKEANQKVKLVIE